jgi:hypothetical protein
VTPKRKRAGRATRSDLRPIADWQDASAYPPPTVSRASLAWEFLRRNPDYRREWAAWAALPERERWARYLDVLDRFGLVWVVPPELPDPIPAPALPDPHCAEVVPDFDGVGLYCVTPGRSVTVAPRPGEVWVMFDTRRPIGPQLEKAREAALSRTADVRTPDPEVLIRYLRILDAADAGVAMAKVARQFNFDGVSPETPRGVIEALRAAERLRDGDYRLIL